MKSKVDLIVFLELLASLSIKYTYAFRNLGGNCVNIFYLLIYLLYLTLIYKIVKNNSTNKYQQYQVKI